MNTCASGVAPEAMTRAARLVLMGFGVGGVLTDGTLYFNSQGEEIKAFASLDGHGLRMLQRAVVEVAIIRGRSSHALELRGIELAQTGYIGDDVVELPILRAQGKWDAAIAEYLA